MKINLGHLRGESFDNPDFPVVKHPFADFTLSPSTPPTIVQPADAREMSRETYLRSLAPEERAALNRFVSELGAEFWQSHSFGLLAVGRSTFTPRSQEILAEYGKRGDLVEYAEILQKVGRDLDFVLVASGNDVKPFDRVRLHETWIPLLTAPLDRAGIEGVVHKDIFDNGTSFLLKVLELTKGERVPPREVTLDQPYPIKVQAEGTSVLLTFPNSRPLHIHVNFMGPAKEVVAVEKQAGLCHSVLFMDGNFGEFLAALSNP